MTPRTPVTLACGVLTPLLLAATAEAKPRQSIAIDVLSNRADLVSGGDALVELRLPPAMAGAPVRVTLGRRDVTAAFEHRSGARLQGLVTGLRDGPNALVARAGKRARGRLTITNHPNGGPVFSGPQVQPWACQETAVDRQCNQPASYRLLYRSTNATQGFQPYDPRRPPRDVATTTTDQGARVPFVIRVETGYQDRDQYKIATLYRPGEPWRPWAPQRQWNRKLLITHGAGCGVAYGAGRAPSVLSDGILLGVPLLEGALGTDSVPMALGRGFAVMSTALNDNGHNCNIVVQAESLMMAKERVVEQYGPPRYTIGTGCSGGSLTQQQVANAYPGIYQGLLTTCSFPDSWTAAMQVLDYHLLRRYFEHPWRWGRGVRWSPLQVAPVEGHVLPLNSIVSDIGYFAAFDPTSGCPGVAEARRYRPLRNPGGVRCSVPDLMVNVFGRRQPSVWTADERRLGRGFAGVALDNVGVQYGLAALRRRFITPDQFLDLNAEIGGLDVDARPTRRRLVADQPALRNAYRSGAINTANNLDRVAIIDLRGPDPAFAHDAYRAWTVRARLEREHGEARNHVIWFGLVPLIGDTSYMKRALLAMDRWLGAVERDPSAKPLARKLADERPRDVRDRCSQVPGLELVRLPGLGRICELESFQNRYGTPRTVAGQPLTTDANKCRLRPPRRADYLPFRLRPDQWERLRAIFPSGVCDWSKPGVDQQGAIPWLTYDGGAGGRPLGPPPRSRR